MKGHVQHSGRLVHGRGLGALSRILRISACIRWPLLSLSNCSRGCESWIHSCHRTWATPELDQLCRYLWFFVLPLISVLVVWASLIRRWGCPCIRGTTALTLGLLSVTTACCLFLSFGVSVLTICILSCFLIFDSGSNGWSASGYELWVHGYRRKTLSYTITQGRVLRFYLWYAWLFFLLLFLSRVSSCISEASFHCLPLTLCWRCRCYWLCLHVASRLYGWCRTCTRFITAKVWRTWGP